MSFRALVVRKAEDGRFHQAVETLEDDRLPPGNVEVEVHYSTVNYKDGLCIVGQGRRVLDYPHVPGIDFSGVVTASNDPRYRAGDGVLLTGWRVGETHWGGFSTKARVEADWLVPLPQAFTPAQAMAIGTAGYTAMLCVLALEQHGLKPGAGEVLVTGATGGVGSTAVALLSKLGYNVVAATGKASEAAYLQQLGAGAVIDRASLSAPGKPLQKERWAAVVDAVGSHTLANVLAQTRYGGAVAACGLAQGFDLPTTVMPFILRNVRLIGVDSVMAPLALRQQAWDRLATDLDIAKLDSMIEEVDLDHAAEKAQALMAGQVRGRVVVRI